MSSEYSSHSGVQLLEHLWKKQSVGGFGIQDIRLIMDTLPADQNGARRDPLGDPLLLELYCLAASAYDHLGRYEEASSFLSRWASILHFEIRGFLQKKRHANIDFPMHAPEKACFLLQAGIAEYRKSDFDAASGYLKGAEELYSLLKEQSDESRNPAITTMLSACCYWLGCVATYASKFPEAEDKFLEGLQFAADVSVERAADEQQIRFAKYLTGRILLGLGLLHYHSGALDLARSSLLAAKVLLHRDSRDQARQARVEMLLLTVKRMEHSGNRNKKDEFEKIIIALKKLANQLDGTHDRYFCRAMSTIARVWLDLADLYRRPSEPPGPETVEQERMAALQSARKIVEEQRSRVGGSVTDQFQLDVIKIRTLRRLGDLDDAIDWGTTVIERREIHHHLLLYMEALFALGHAHYDRWKRYHREVDLVNAKKLITEAGKKVLGNPRAEAVRCLHLARIAHAQGLYNEAQAELNEWERLSKIVKLGWIERFADRVKAEICSANTLTISMEELDNKKGVYPILESQLRDFLLTRVIAGMQPEDAIKKLGVSRQTYYNWTKPSTGLPQVVNASKRRGRRPVAKGLSVKSD